MPRDFPETFRTFVNKNFSSVEQVEVLLLLYAQPERRWTAEEISTSLRSATTSVSARLVALQRAGFVVADGGGYRYAARGHAGEMIELLAREYTVRRFSIIELIFSRTSTARTFADAFRLREEPDEDHR